MFRFLLILSLELIPLIKCEESPKLMPLASHSIQSEGTSFTLLCSTQKGSNPLFFQWLRNGQVLTSSSETSYKVDTSERLNILTIASVSRSDAGNYTCVVRNAFGSDSQNVLLDVRVPPVWVKEPNDIRVNSGDNKIIECIADGLPKPSVKWISSQGFVIENELLDLSKLTTITSDAYECIADNGIGDALRKTITIYFNEPPKIVPYNSHIIQSEDSLFQVLCSVAKGSKPLYFQWTKDGQVLKSDPSNNYRIENSETRTILSIESLKRFNSGNYTCLVNNAFGKDSHTIALVVKVPPKWTQEPYDVKTSIKDISIVCKADGVPKPSIKWITPKGVIESETLYLTKSMLMSLRSKDRFECIADNGEDNKLRKVIKLIVKEPPLILKTDTKYEPFYEGSRFSFLCSLKSGSNPFFTWTKNGQKLSQHENGVTIRSDGSQYDSVLSINHVKRENAGNYSCIVNNKFGSDSYTIKLEVYAPSEWINEPQNITAIYGSNVEINCDADGLPKPKIVWRKVLSNSVYDSVGNVLKVSKIKKSDSGQYECIVYNNNNMVLLRKLIYLKVSVPAKFDEKYSLIQVKRGESARLKCNASGDQPLTVKWTKDNVKLDKIGGHNYEIFETTTEIGILSELLLRTTQRTDGTIYRCDAENEHGKDERTIKLVVVEVPGPPMNVHVKEVWSRTASVVWSPPYSGNSPISKYTVQYWRHESAPHRLHELSISSSQTSALIKDLSPGLSYEMTVVGENEVGRGETADTVTFITGEEEPGSPPNDITVEARGPTTIRVTWRAPPSETWNGVIKGYYVGYRKAHEPSSHPLTLKLVESKPSQNPKNIEMETYEYFIRDLMKNTEYAIILKAYNSAGSGPESHALHVHTLDGDTPPAQQLTSIESTANSISLRWHQKDIRESQTPVTSFTIHYKKEGEPKWKEVPIFSLTTPTPMPDISSISTYTYTLQNLESGIQYRIFITALNRYGFSDPSNIVITTTEGERQILQSEMFNPFYDGPYYLQPSFTIPLLTAAVIVIIVIIFAFVCVRKIRHRATAEGLMMDSATLSKQFAGYTGTAPRYMDFDKTSGKPLMMTEQGNIYPTPYATMPMGGGDGSQKPWERPLPLPSSMKKDHHIYDHPQ